MCVGCVEEVVMNGFERSSDEDAWDGVVGGLSLRISSFDSSLS